MLKVALSLVKGLLDGIRLEKALVILNSNVIAVIELVHARVQIIIDAQYILILHVILLMLMLLVLLLLVV